MSLVGCWNSWIDIFETHWCSNQNRLTIWNSSDLVIFDCGKQTRQTTITVWILGNFSQNLLLYFWEFTDDNTLANKLVHNYLEILFIDGVDPLDCCFLQWVLSVRLLWLCWSRLRLYCLLLLSPIATAAILSFNTKAKLCSFFYTALFALQLSKGWELLLGLY